MNDTKLPVDWVAPLVLSQTQCKNRNTLFLIIGKDKVTLQNVTPQQNIMTKVAKSKQVDQGKCLLYAGTYTANEGEGIYVYKTDFLAGSQELVEVNRDIKNPSYMAVNDKGNRLYAVNEVSEFKGEATGAICAYAVDEESGGLSFLNQKSSQGKGPCYVSLSSTGKNLLVSNYNGGSIAVFSIDPNGALAEMTDFKQHYQTGYWSDRQARPHPHSIITAPEEECVLVPDLGSDQIFVYETKQTKEGLKLRNTGAIDCKPGSGPRHIVFDPKGKFVYVVNELNSSIYAFKYEQAGKRFNKIQKISTLPLEFTDSNAPAEIQIHPSGNYLYASNRGHNSIAIFNIDKNNGELSSLGHESTRGSTPRNFGFDPIGQFLLAANRKSDNIAVFATDKNTGALKFTGQKIDVPEPACIKTIPFNRNT